MSLSKSQENWTVTHKPNQTKTIRDTAMEARGI